MRKLTIALLAALAVAVLAVACGDDDDNGGDTSPAGTTSTETGEPTRTEDADTTPTNGGGDKTPSNATPDESTPVPTEAGPQPTPAAEGTPATVIDDPNYFSTNYPGKTLAESPCGFSPMTYVVTCGSDKYAPKPPLTGQDVACFLLSVDNAPVAIRCNSQEPLQSIYYEIQG